MNESVMLADKLTTFNNDSGLIHIYCGEGKGKTTAALGLALRVACAGGKVLILQFLKSADTSEMQINKVIKNINILTVQKNVKFVFKMTSEEKLANLNENNDAFLKITSEVSQYDMLVFDEIIGCIHLGQFDEILLTDFLKNKPKNLEVVLTGRNPSQTLIDAADYVSEVRKIKHPFDKGVIARKGIEF